MSSCSSSAASGISGNIKVPGDKSISHRSLILSSQAIGRTEISGLLESEDVLNTAQSLQKLGVSIERSGDKWIVQGVGVGGLCEPEGELDLGNSGTGVRLLMGLVAPYNFDTKFTGDESLKKRPMQRVTGPLEEMGVAFESSEGGRLPLTVKGTLDCTPITHEMSVASAQVKSAILLAAMAVSGKTTVIEKEATRDHTELMLKFLGADIEVDGNRITLNGNKELKARDIIVPADPSSAAFFIVAALIVPNSEISIKNVCLNPLRVGLFDTLIEMGANIEFENKREEAGEIIADIRAKTSELKGVTVPASRAPSMIDEYPILSVAAAFADGVTRMEGLEELKVKESDRLQAIIDGLDVNGVEHKAGDDWLEVVGKKEVQGGGTVKTHMDHRIAMSFLVMGAASKNPVTVDDLSMIATSFPNFPDLFKTVGGQLK